MGTTDVDAPAARTAHPQRGVGSVLVLALLVVVNFVVGALGGLSTASGVDGWYADAEKVPWTPPNGVFAPAWSVLYVLMGVSAWLVWRRGGWAPARTALTLYVVQLALNAAWTPIFFSGRLVWVALGIIVALEVVLVATAIAFWKHSRVASWLLGPYLTWVAFATTLNLGIAVLN
jgi:benzodiazapine receptor